LPSSDLAIDGETAEGDEQFDWEWLVSQTVHPMKVSIVEAIRWIDRPVTSNDLFKSFDRPGGIGNVGYHVTELAKMGVLYAVRQQPVRGTKETYYFFTSAVWSAT
jgi:hypothetical protein